jgi:hypothetical protein
VKRFLVVGCGGSGGSTLAFIMDQLRSDLAALGVSQIPSGWQFVHIDVPMSADTRLEGVGSVPQQGGRYIPTGSSTGSYTTLDHALAQRLNGAHLLRGIATWAPRRPDEVKIPPSTGAGQYRAVGRAIMLNKATDVLEGLERSWEALSSVQAQSEMSRLGQAHPVLGPFSAADAPIVLVVGSMAGGAGASMTLDVCRLLTLIPGVSPGLIGVFMVAPDAFESLPDAARFGTRANALAMLGEIVAAQSGASREHDVEMLRALGHSAGAGAEVPFARVFPVGRYLGSDMSVLGDGTQEAVYRTLGRGLAALMTSDDANHPFVQYDLTNTGSPPGDRSFLGWGVEWPQLAWGSFGYATLSMGRDRYAEYAAQRIARSCVDQLLDGHLQRDSGASGTEELRALLDSQWAHLLRGLQLPQRDGQARQSQALLGQWFTQVALPDHEVGRHIAKILESDVTPYLAAPDGQEGGQWVGTLRAQLTSRRRAVTDRSDAAAYEWAFGWQQDLVRRALEVVGESVALHGLPYGAAVVDRMRDHIDDFVMPGLRDLATHAKPNVQTVPPEFEGAVGGLRGIIANGHLITTKVLDLVRNETRTQVYARSAALAEQTLGAFVTDVLRPLADALREAQTLLEQARKVEAVDEGLAHVVTDTYRAWPSDDDVAVPTRFSRADNEVLLTNPDTFDAQYESDLRAAVAHDGAPALAFDDARSQAAQQVTAGVWPTTGAAVAPGGLIEQTAAWRSRVFPTHPGTGSALVPARARFEVHARPAELLARARMFVSRPSESFSVFADMSLHSYAAGAGALESERDARATEVVAKFSETLGLARPLMRVNDEAVQRLHGVPVAYRYKFSALPFGENPALGQALARTLDQTPGIDRSSHDNLDAALVKGDNGVTRVDVFGSYMNYSPLAFDGVLRRVAAQWGQTPAHQRGDFWRWRRARPLPAALPMGQRERRAMVAGWFLAQITGDLRIPAEPYDEPVRIWDPVGRTWLDFPHPLLTPPSAFLAPFDWLPAVLESVLIAYVRSIEPPVMSSLRPYQVLRAAYDDSDYEASGGLATLAGQRRLTAWLGTGRSESGGASRVVGADTATSAAGRAEAVRAFLAVPRTMAEVHFMAPGQDGATGGGEFATIDSRSQAAATPMFRDIAPDVRWACEELDRLVTQAVSPTAPPVF